MIKKMMEAALEVSKTAALDGTLNATDLKSNRKKVVFSLVKSAAWMLVQRHPAYIMLKLALWGFGVLAFLVVAGVIAYVAS